MARNRKTSRRGGRRVRLRFSKAGWLLVAVAILVGWAAAREQSLALLYILFGGMMGALYISTVVARRMIGDVHVRREVPARVWQHRSVPLGYHLRNGRKGRHCLGIQLDEVSPAGVESAAGYCVHLPPRTSFRAGGRFAAKRRGRLEFTALELSTRFPFGLVIATRRIEEPATLMVWPARGRLKAQLLKRGAVEVSSAAPSGARGGQDEFFGLRDYREDDNPRWIHWRRSALRPTPVVREMALPLPEALWIVLDTACRDQSDVSIARREKMLRFAATLADHAFARGYKVGLATWGRSGPVALSAEAGRGQRSRVLDALAETDWHAERSMGRAADQIPRGATRDAQVMVLTARAHEIDTAALNTLRRAGRCLRIIDDAQLNAVFADEPPATVQDGAVAGHQDSEPGVGEGGD